MAKGNIDIRLNTEKRIYDDSPNVQVTYKDLSRIIEYLLEINKDDRRITGFSNKNGGD